MKDLVEVLAGSKSVYDQRPRHAEDRHADAPSAELDEAQNCDQPDRRQERSHLRAAGERHDQAVVAEIVDQKTRKAREHDNDIIPGHAVRPDMLLRGRVVQKSHEHHQPEKQGQPLLESRPREERRQNAVGREYRHYAVDCSQPLPLPDAGVGLEIIFFHDLVQIFICYDIFFRQEKTPLCSKAELRCIFNGTAVRLF